MTAYSHEPLSSGVNISLFRMCAALLVAGIATAQSPPPRPPNDRGRIPILEYHLITDHDSRWGRSADHFRRALKLLYDRGYRPIPVSQLIDKQFDIPAG